MKISKVLLWIVNIAMFGSVLIFISFIYVQEYLVPIEKPEKERNLAGALSMTEHRNLSNRFYDLDYYFIYREGEVLIDSYMISTKRIGKSFNYVKGTKDDFLKVQTTESSIYMPNISENLAVPVAGERIGFFKNLSRFIIFATWLFFVTQLVWLRKLLKNSVSGRFFEKSNVGVFVKLGILYIALPIVLIVMDGTLVRLILPDGLVLPDGYELALEGSEFQFQYLFVGLMLLLIAQAFNQGLKLKNEQELTI